jgi:thiol-disulfide isomerase/thioredoxin/DNA-binding beta-propeller fold protein YncE
VADAKIRCPEFPEGVTWINTTRPLSVAEDLRGRVALLDFWTYCCINCMHVLPVLKRIEERFAGEPLVVVGVHSAKFISEKDPRNIRQAVRRHGVRHPVVVDSDHDIWERFAVHAWPTLFLVDAAGYIRETLSGEVDEEPLARGIERLLEEGRERALLAPDPLEVAPDPETDQTFLRFPGKIHIDGGRLFIADSRHNRIVVTALDGRVQAVIGEGGAGAKDGPAPHASFHDPQGLAVIGDRLFVADTGNHLIRTVSLSTYEVTTVAGTGRKGGAPAPYDPERPRSIPLRSPWGLLAVGAHLLVAMAGSHQIWVFDPEGNRLGPWAGSGREDHVDGSLAAAAFAQPSGLARAGKLLLIADSEVSSIRAIDLDEGEVKTIVGRGLFDFGDRDGAPEQVLLQHPLDLAVDGNSLYIADTFNNKIKSIAFGSMTTRTVLGDGRPETMHEPGGLAVSEGKVWIADTNNHRILRGDPSSGALEVLPIHAE